MWWFRCGVSIALWLDRRSSNPKAMGLIPIRTNSFFLSLIFTAKAGVCDSLSHSYAWIRVSCCVVDVGVATNTCTVRNETFEEEKKTVDNTRGHWKKKKKLSKPQWWEKERQRYDNHGLSLLACLTWRYYWWYSLKWWVLWNQQLYKNKPHVTARREQVFWKVYRHAPYWTSRHCKKRKGLLKGLSPCSPLNLHYLLFLFLRWVDRQGKSCSCFPKRSPEEETLLQNSLDIQ